ncbi:MAG: anti-sigma factor [Actinomycetota bacterium]|nr:anti-sigma factor [Actinomycetota bacterium]
MDLHDLTAGYALDALDAGDRERYEVHLATCEPCREELQGFWLVSGALARAAGGPAPRAELRTRILAQARSERSNVVPLRRRFALPALSSAAAVAAVAAIGLGIWGTSLQNRLDEVDTGLAVLAHPEAETFDTTADEASLVITPAGEAALIVRNLSPAPEGKDYVIWVLDNGVSRRAGLFDARGVTKLSRLVEPGQRVAVTLEVEGGVEAPTSAPIFTAASA